MAYHLTMLAAGTAFLGLPYAEDFWRCLRATLSGEIAAAPAAAEPQRRIA
jgi:hypothetical protein